MDMGVDDGHGRCLLLAGAVGPARLVEGGEGVRGKLEAGALEIGIDVRGAFGTSEYAGEALMQDPGDADGSTGGAQVGGDLVDVGD